MIRNEQVAERDNRINQLVANGLRISSKTVPVAMECP